jgi:heat shock protein HslJ
MVWPVQVLMTHIYLLFGLVLIVAGCTATPQPPAIEGNWQLVFGNVAGQALPLVEGHLITLQVEGTNAAGSSACNQYGGSVTIDGSKIVFGDLVSTLMGCEADVMAAESAYTNALRQVDTISFEGDDLILTGPDADLRFTPIG